MGKSYLVEGAKLRCMCGSKCSYLKIPFGHGYTADGKKKANCTDCIPEANIPNFGQCKMNKKGKICKGYMKLASKWENTGGSSWKLEMLNNQTALTMDSVLLCNRGGLIVPETSGQGDVQKINWEAYEKRYGSWLSFMQGVNSGCLFGFDPINLNTGNFIYEKEDLVIHGITALSFHMTYNSMNEYVGGSIGEGWHHNYEIFVQCGENGTLSLYLGDAQQIAFRRSMGNIYVPVYGNRGMLKQEPDGYRYVESEGREYAFDSEGKVLSRKDRNGNTDTFLYNDKGQLSEVQGANGGALYYHYNREGNLYRVCDHTDREVRLWYSYGVLQKFVNSLGQAYTYGYNENLRLESVTTPRGIIGVRNDYDSVNRVVKQFMPDGGVVELKYDDEGICTYAKDQNGYITSYQSDERFRNIQTESKDGKERFKYNDNNQITFYEDQNGNQTRYQYDEKGYLTGVINALGEWRNFTYNKEGKVLSYAIDGKEVLKNEYDETGHLVKTTDALGRTRQTVYDGKGMPKRFIMPDGSSIEMCHDERGNIQSITYPDHSTIRYVYDALNRVTETVDAEGNKVKYQYDARDHLLSVINEEGAERKYTYNVSGKLTAIEDYDGGIFTISYNAMGKPESVTDKEGRETKRIYDLAGNIVEEVLPIGAVTAYEYDRENRLTRVKRKASGQNEAVTVVDYTYDLVGNLLKAEAGDGREVLSEISYEYDALNRVTAIMNPVGGKTVYTYDRRNGKVSSITDAAGNRSTFRYNDVGELTEKTDIKGNITRYTYNALGEITSVTDGAGRITRYSYLPGGRLEQISYPDGKQMHYSYDGMGRVQKKTDGQGYSLSYTYDSMGRVLRITGSRGEEKTYTYDMMGNVTAVTDARGNRTEYTYTLSGKLKEVKDALGNKTEYAYDAADKLIHICQHGETGEEDRITDYERNVFGQVECVRNAVGLEECYRYDALGRMVEKTDRDGLKTAYTYSMDGKAESIVYDDGNRVEFQYTPLRQLALIKDWLGETRMERNCYGEPVRITDHVGRTVRYEWGDMGERKKMIYPDGTVVSMHYDNLLHLTELVRLAEGKENLRISYQYDSQGRFSGKHSSGGYHTAFHYNDAGQLDELSHEDAAGIIDRYCYEYDAMGNKTAIRKERRGLPEESGSYHYVYDALQRLICVEKDGEMLRRYEYDSFGNRLGMEDYEQRVSSTFVYDALNRLIEERKRYNSDLKGEKTKADVFVAYEYDRRGNLTGEYEGERLLHGYRFNAMNRLEKAWDEDGREAVYSYNSLGQRTTRNEEGKREEYLLDLTKSYNNLLSIEYGSIKQNFYWDFGVSAMEQEGRKPRYYLTDELGSPLRALYDNGNGDSYGYDEFGRDVYGIGKEEMLRRRYGRQGEGQPFGYTGYRYDDISGTYFAQAREYQPENGRFTAEDVIKGNVAYPETLNHYGYCWNNPVALVDRDGREPEIPLPEVFSSTVKPSNEVKFPTIEPDNDKINLPTLIEPIEVQKEVQKSSGNTEEDKLLIICQSYSMPTMFYLSVGEQFVFDKYGNCGVQYNVGIGIRAGLGGGWGISVAQLGVPNIEDAEGLGTEAGAYLGLGLSGITAWNEEGYVAGTGEMLNLSQGIEGHIAISWTIDQGDIDRLFKSSLNALRKGINSCAD